LRQLAEPEAKRDHLKARKDPEQISALWRKVAPRVADSGGTVNLLTHCEAGFSGNPATLAQYHGFLEWLAADARFEVTLPTVLVNRLDSMIGSTAAATP
jgi:hypothetical protein